jgi:anti-sigma regulatory factor (Ser/Thr protein kinase)
VSSNGQGRVTRRWQLTPDPLAARVARRLIRSACDDWGVDPGVCYDALVVVTELVTNVVEHAGTECRLAISIGKESLRIEVRDFHRSRPRPRSTTYTGLARGRGLHLVASLSSQWGVTVLNDGKTVWAMLATTPPPQTPPAH